MLDINELEGDEETPELFIVKFKTKDWEKNSTLAGGKFAVQIGNT